VKTYEVFIGNEWRACSWVEREGSGWLRYVLPNGISGTVSLRQWRIVDVPYSEKPGRDQLRPGVGSALVGLPGLSKKRPLGPYKGDAVTMKIPNRRKSRQELRDSMYEVFAPGVPGEKFTGKRITDKDLLRVLLATDPATIKPSLQKCFDSELKRLQKLQKRLKH
jgi:hypothetical protein